MSCTWDFSFIYFSSCRKWKGQRSWVLLIVVIVWIALLDVLRPCMNWWKSAGYSSKYNLMHWHYKLVCLLVCGWGEFQGEYKEPLIDIWLSSSSGMKNGQPLSKWRRRWELSITPFPKRFQTTWKQRTERPLIDQKGKSIMHFEFSIALWCVLG